MRLTIRISTNALSFSAQQADGTIAYEPYHVKSGVSIAANLRQAFSESELLASGYKSVLVLMDAPVLLIPIEEYQQETVEVLYTTAYKADHSSTVLHSVLPDVNAVAAFSMNKDLRLVLDDNFNDVAIIPLMQPVWKWLYRRSFDGTRRKLYAYLHDRKMELFSFRQNRLSFCNTFEATHAADAAYYLLAAWQQLGFKADADALHLVGSHAEKEALKNMVSEYIPNIQELTASTEFADAPSLQHPDMPFDLHTLYAKGR